jgi:site-specific recombinase XerD
MANMTARMVPVHPVPVHPVPVLSDRDVSALLKVCAGRDFPGLRDTAVIRLLLDTGIRRTELVGLTLDDVDLKNRTVKGLGKGRRPGVGTLGRGDGIGAGFGQPSRIQLRADGGGNV